MLNLNTISSTSDKHPEPENGDGEHRRDGHKLQLRQQGQRDKLEGQRGAQPDVCLQ